MNIREIQDRLIGAETIMRELSEGRVGPAPLRAQQLPYLHTRTDMNGWGKKPGERDMLLIEDADAHSIYRREFWEQFDPGPTPEEVSLAHRIKDWIMLVDDDSERRALQAWVRAMAGGRSFARWCRNVEHIAVMTGRRRKNRAVEKILMQLSGKRDLHDENRMEPMLPVAAEISHLPANLATGVSGEETGLNSWWSNDAFAPIHKVLDVYDSGLAKQSIAVDPSEFTWAKRRSEQRRQREARRRKQAA